MSSRREFIQGHGATCRNWRWSWAFVNYDQRFIISGAWDRHWSGRRYTVLDQRWERDPATGRRRPGYEEALDYLRLMRDHNYRLKIFDMTHMYLQPGHPLGTAVIADFNPVLMDARLETADGVWFAIPNDGSVTDASGGPTP